MVQPTWSPPDLTVPETGYRHTLDTWLLAAFAAQRETTSWCDLGTGNGAIAFALSHAFPASKGTAIERQPELWTCAATNLAGSRVTLIRGDLRTYPWADTCFDLIVCNPPYFEPGKGLLSPGESRAAARHALHGDLEEFARVLRYSLTEQGRICYIYRADRAEEAERVLAADGWHINRRQLIRSFANEDPVLTCTEITRTEPSSVVESGLILYTSHRAWTAEAVAHLTAHISARHE